MPTEAEGWLPRWGPCLWEVCDIVFARQWACEHFLFLFCNWASFFLSFFFFPGYLLSSMWSCSSRKVVCTPKKWHSWSKPALFPLLHDWLMCGLRNSDKGDTSGECAGASGKGFFLLIERKRRGKKQSLYCLWILLWENCGHEEADRSSMAEWKSRSRASLIQLSCWINELWSCLVLLCEIITVLQSLKSDELAGSLSCYWMFHKKRDGDIHAWGRRHWGRGEAEARTVRLETGMFL